MASRPIISLLGRYLRPHWRRTAVAAVCLVVANAATLTGPVLIKEIVDRLDPPELALAGLSGGLLLLLVAYAVARLSVALLTEFRELVFIPVTRTVIQRVQQDLHRHLLRLPMSFHRSRETGALSQTVRQGLGGLQSLVSHALYSVIPTALELSLGVGLLAWCYPWPIAATVSAGVAVYIVFTRPVARVLANQRTEINRLDARAHQIEFEMLMNVELVQTLAGEDRESRRLQSVLDAHRMLILRSARWTSVLNLGQQTIMIVCTTTALFLAIDAHRAGLMTVGDVVLVLSLVIQAFTPLSILGGVYQEIRHALVDLSAVVDLMPHPASGPRSEIPPRPLRQEVGSALSGGEDPGKPPAISLRGVGIALGDGAALRSVSLDMPAGSLTAIVGPSGSGKTTLARLIAGQVQPDIGILTIGDSPVDTIKHDAMCLLVGIMPSTTSLFTDSIEANIRYPEAVPARTGTDPALLDAARRAGLHDWVSSLPDGYATELEESGGALSAGEKQRIGIARMLLRAPPVLLFDEPTSALDTDADRRVMDSLLALRGRHTIVVIAHRLSSVIRADRIAVMADGRIIDAGTHDELVARCALYQRLWAAQRQGGDHDQ